MKRSWWIWLAFASCLAVVMAAMGWISLTAWRLDRAEIEMRRQAAIEENVRLALWRIDSSLASLVTQESVRPYFVYRPFITTDRAYDRMFNDRSGRERLVPSPLLSTQTPGVLAYFQFGPDGSLTSPQLPTGANQKLAVPQWTSPEKIAEAEEQLARLRAVTDRKELLTALPKPATPSPAAVASTLNLLPEQQAEQRLRRSSSAERGQGFVEYELRNQAVQQSANAAVLTQNNGYNSNIDILPASEVDIAPMKPLWIGGQLILARRVTLQGADYVQGCLVDWPTIKASLLETITDLLPHADLLPVFDAAGKDGPRMAAALPVRLEPNAPAPGREALLSPIVLPVGVAWVCVLAAAAVGAGLVAAVMGLAERRAAFVNAVTHELRTPLTTFQMYAEMLAEGMVPDPAQQHRYLNTLRAESVRVTHLVENVLAYARLERGRHGRQTEQLTLDDLVGRMLDRLTGRAAQSGMRLAWEEDAALGEVLVHANVSAVEQILFNLVDNACKYAATAADKTIRLSLYRADSTAGIRIADQGPGVCPEMRRRLFRSFSKSAQEAARSAPGIGLGLALSRRLARDMGGDLRFEPNGSTGASFLLTLPTAQ